MPHSIAPSNVKSVATYDTSGYGEDLFFPLTDVGLTEQSFTISGATITRDTHSGNQPIDGDPVIIHDTDNGMIEHEGNNTAFTQTYRWHPDMSAVIYKTRFHVAFGLNISAYTSGNFNLGKLTVTFQETKNPNRIIYQNTFDSGATNQTGTGISYHIFDQDVIESYKVYRGQPIDITFTMETTAGTGTRQEGLISFFPNLATARPKIFYVSGVSFHVHASLDHADPVYRQDMRRLSVLGQ